MPILGADRFFGRKIAARMVKGVGANTAQPKEEGFKSKYNVYKIEDNSLVSDCFVLRPGKDPAAIAALRAYVCATKNTQLSKDILHWTDSICAAQENKKESENEHAQD